MQEGTGFYKFRTKRGWQCYAALSKDAILQHLEGLNNNPEVVMFLVYPKTLNRITEDEASIAPYFRHFDIERKLCRDGTWDLGKIQIL